MALGWRPSHGGHHYRLEANASRLVACKKFNTQNWYMNYHETNQGTTATNQQLKQQQVHLHLLGALHPLPFQRFSFVGQSSSLAALPPCQNCLHSHGHVLGGPLPPLQAWTLLHHELSEGCHRPCGQGPCGQGTGTTSQAANQAGCLEDGNHRVPQVIGIYTHSYSTR